VGLAAARERVEAFGGGFHIRSVPGGGSELTCLVPLASSLD
jgi:signal transduction histidine kinase